MLVQGPILQGEGSTVPVESHHTPSGAPTTSQPLLSSPLRILTRQETEVPQADSLLTSIVTHLEVDAVNGALNELTDASQKNVNTFYKKKEEQLSMEVNEIYASMIFSTAARKQCSTAGASMPVSTAGMVQQVNIIIPSLSETTKDKGKALMKESEQPKKIKKRVQIQMSLDEEFAQKLHEKEQARFNAEQEAKFNAEQEELLASETTKDKANPPVADIDWDDVQAQIQAYKDLAQKLLEEERENLSIKERARLFAELNWTEKEATSCTTI
ncbi:hypothetical protein Tco_1576186 [Tanacetum coccineum]